MKISIVTPVYNGGKFIRETLLSIHKQSYENFENIVIDGLSTDDTLSIIKEFKDVKCISEKDSGQSDALNKGFKLVSGDILAWQNADDVYLPNTFKTIVDYFILHPDIDIVYGSYEEIDENGASICAVYPINWNKWLFAHGRFCPVQPAVFWRRSLYEQVGTLNENLHYCMDVDFYSRAINQNFKFAHIPDILGKFRVHKDSKTQNSKNYKRLISEYKYVLSNNFGYKSIDYFIFYMFQYRASIGKLIKQNWLRK